jgi:uncharacterized linocin/CFP29 family protein
MYHQAMGLKRTNVYAEDSDLELIKEAAARVGKPEAEIIREGIHRIALAYRVWEEPFVTDEETYDLGGPVTAEDIRDAVVRGHESRERRNTEGQA